MSLPHGIPGDGACFRACNPETMDPCREGYLCVHRRQVRRQLLPAICAPPRLKMGVSQSCTQKLTQLGIQFTRSRDPRKRLWGRRFRVCSVVDALRVYPPIHGVDWIDGAERRVPLFMRCELALAISRLTRYLASQGITKVMHFGTYNCKSIRTDKGYIGKLSQHGLGRALDLAAFWDRKGTMYSLVKHWDHKTTWRNAQGEPGCWSTKFKSPQARKLYQIACGMWKQKLFSTILTPNFNRVHDDHFHVDLSSPTGSFAGVRPVRAWIDGKWPK